MSLRRGPKHPMFCVLKVLQKRHYFVVSLVLMIDINLIVPCLVPSTSSATALPFTYSSTIIGNTSSSGK